LLEPVWVLVPQLLLEPWLLGAFWPELVWLLISFQQQVPVVALAQTALEVQVAAQPCKVLLQA
jgi:hypothetical protein